MTGTPQPRTDRRWSGPLRPFLVTSFQSYLGNEMAYVGLLLLAYAQEPSSWAITALLIAEFLPPMLLGSAAGALADRHSRRTLVVSTDVVRAVAFVGLAVSPSIITTLALATVVSFAQTVFRPASRASVPSLAGHERVDDAMGALSFSYTVASTAGPLLAAVLLLAGGPATVMLVNAATFLISAAIISRLPLDRRGPKDRRGDAGASEEPEVPGGARRTIALLRTMDVVPAVFVAGIGAALAFAMINVAEPLLVRDTLGGGESAFALLVAIYGAGAILGSALARTRLDLLFVAVAGSVVTVGLTALSPTVPVAAALFAATGVFNGLYLTSEDRLLASLVPQAVQGRVYGFKDSLESGAFLAAYAVAGAVAALSGPRAVFLVSALTALALGLVALRFVSRSDEKPTAPR
ncbi:MAG: MFS transporter [Solirubrobacteraceae bacterium]|nr:MFS transporter [Solirubrobacteraceae bacterium]